MYHRSWKWKRSKNHAARWEGWTDKLWVWGLLLAALILFSINLGGLALRDWDEGTIAQVAREIASAPESSLKWLYPTLNGEPYLNKPPLLHLLIAGAYKIGGVNEWTTRLPAAILTAFSIPLVYGIGRELFKSRIPAIFAALIYLTLLPVVRHGRLAMLDGPVLCFGAFAIWCVLRSRRDLRWSLGAGIGFGLICLTKGMMGVLLGAIAFLFILWDTPRLLTSCYVWVGVLLGLAPAIGWYTANWLHYGEDFIGTGIVDQSLRRIWEPVDSNGGYPWYYLLEILKYGWPWLLLVPLGLRLTWENRNWGWAKLVLVWSIVYLVAISVMGTKLPWYVLPMYPAIALTGGVQLAEIWHHWPSDRPYPRAWVIGLAFLGLVACGGIFYFAGLGGEVNGHLQLVLAAAALTFFVAAILIVQRDLQFIPILFWGTYVSLLLFITSPHWVWELAEAYPVKPVAAIIKQNAPVGQQVYTSFTYARPSLNFYSDRQVIPADTSELLRRWNLDPDPYLLLDASAIEQLKLKQVKTLGTAAGWTLVTHNVD